jgi:hypothetical protein
MPGNNETLSIQPAKTPAFRVSGKIFSNQIFKADLSKYLLLRSFSKLI